MTWDIRKEPISCFYNLIRKLKTCTVIKNVSEQINTNKANCILNKMRVLHVEILNYL